ncbi:SEC-C domain-containing protein [Cronobacter dublinensis]
MKYGRNEKCWCGSGIKFKKCHLNRSSMNKISRGDLESHHKKNNNVKYCSTPEHLHNECTKKMIKAHTISKSSSLKSIAQDGHVMGIKPSFSSLDQNNGCLKFERIGINSASTFTGFCSKHDAEIFSPIENQAFTPTKENCFLLSYRPVSREFYTKRNNSSTAELLKKMDQGLHEGLQLEVQMIAQLFNSGVDMALNDLDTLKSGMDEILSKKLFNEMSHYVFELNSIPLLNASASIFPDIDFNGNEIQDLLKPNANAIIFNCFASDEKGYFIFSWLNEQESIARKFIETLINKPDIEDRLVAFLFSYCENTFCSPLWWESLDFNAKEDIEKRVMEGASPFHVRSKNTLSIQIPNYKAFSIKEHYRL